MLRHAALLITCVALAATASAGPTAKEATEAAGSRIEMPGVGLSFVAPAKWYSQSASMDENLTRYGLSDAERAEILKRSAGGKPLASYQKYEGKSHAGMMPTINVLVLANPTKNAKQLAKALKGSIDGMGKTLTDFAIVSAPSIVKVRDVESVEVTVSFTMPLRDGKSSKVIARTLAIPMGEFFLQISFTEPADDRNESVYAAFQESLRFSS